MTSFDQKPEPLFADSLDDEDVNSRPSPNGYDPSLASTVFDPIISPVAAARGDFVQEALFHEPSMTHTSQDTWIDPEAIMKEHKSRSDLRASAAPPDVAVSKSAQANHFEQFRRTTVLPKAQLTGDVPTLRMLPRERYEQLKDLGAGAAGDVLLARDNDIQRLVALKRLKKKHHAPASLARFVEEIQTVGQLEHPNIVPIHDVGIDENGQYYFVMKYVEGQTMAEIIDLLKAGDRETHTQYTFDVRNQIFLKALQAMQFAHRLGIIHRDIKPDNIMVGSCGQVMIMDWGIAKRIPAPAQGQKKKEIAASEKQQAMGNVLRGIQEELADTQLPEGTFEANATALVTHERLFETRVGTLIGTPAYMSPEQAMGNIDQIDEHSDIYSLSALYYEWMSLEHYLGHKTDIKELLWGIIEEVPKFMSFHKSPHQDAAPVEFGYFVAKGLQKEADKRFVSIEEMIHDLQLAMSGKFGVHCPITLIKRSGNETLRLIDRFPQFALSGVFLGIVLILLGVFQLGYWTYWLMR